MFVFVFVKSETRLTSGIMSGAKAAAQRRERADREDGDDDVNDDDGGCCRDDREALRFAEDDEKLKRMRTFPFRFTNVAPVAHGSTGVRRGDAGPVRGMSRRPPLRELRNRGAPPSVALQLQELLEFRQEELEQRETMIRSLRDQNRETTQMLSILYQMELESNLRFRTFFTMVALLSVAVATSLCSYPDLFRLALDSVTKQGVMQLLNSIPIGVYFVALFSAHAASLHLNMAISARTWSGMARMLAMAVIHVISLAEVVALSAPDTDLDAWVRSFPTTSYREMIFSYSFLMSCVFFFVFSRFVLDLFKYYTMPLRSGCDIRLRGGWTSVTVVAFAQVVNYWVLVYMAKARFSVDKHVESDSFFSQTSLPLPVWYLYQFMSALFLAGLMLDARSTPLM